MRNDVLQACSHEFQLAEDWVSDLGRCSLQRFREKIRWTCTTARVRVCIECTVVHRLLELETISLFLLCWTKKNRYLFQKSTGLLVKKGKLIRALCSWTFAFSGYYSLHFHHRTDHDKKNVLSLSFSCFHFQTAKFSEIKPIRELIWFVRKSSFSNEIVRVPPIILQLHFRFSLHVMGPGFTLVYFRIFWWFLADFSVLNCSEVMKVGNRGRGQHVICDRSTRGYARVRFGRLSIARSDEPAGLLHSTEVE